MAARALGVSLADARSAADGLHAAALAAVGVEVGSLGDGATASFGRRRPPLTSEARAVLKRVAGAARPRRGCQVDTGRCLVELLALERPDPAAQLLDALGAERAEVRERLRS